MKLRFRLHAATIAALLGLALSHDSLAQCTSDAFEPNDTCQEAAVLPVGHHANLVGELHDPDWFRFEVPAAQSFYVEFTFHEPDTGTAAFATLKEEGLAGTGCPTAPGHLIVVYASPTTGQQTFRFRWDSPADSSRVYLLELFFFGNEECTDYDLSLTMAANDCLLTPDNGLEDNDSCDSPATIGNGVLPGQRVSIADPDFYSLTAAPGELLTVTASGFPLGNQFNFFAWDPAIGCGGSVTAGGTVAHGQVPEVGFYLFNEGVTPRTWTIHVQPTPNQLDETGFCFDYDFEVRSEGGLCQPDILEPNNDCGSAPIVTPGFYGDLNIRTGDQEHMFIDVPDGATLRATTTATTPLTLRPMHLYDGCGGSFLSSSQFFQSSDKQLLEWTNTTGSDVQARLFLWNAAASYLIDFCPTYSLDLEVGFGEPFCQGNVNATGFRSRLSVLGSQAVGTGVTTLRANHLPSSTLGLVFFGFATRPPVTLGDGRLCIDAPLQRLPPANAVSGILEIDIDWQAPGAANAILSGQPVYFQAWYRDPSPGGSGSNTSGGLSVTFE